MALRCTWESLGRLRRSRSYTSVGQASSSRSCSSVGQPVAKHEQGPAVASKGCGPHRPERHRSRDNLPLLPKSPLAPSLSHLPPLPKPPLRTLPPLSFLVDDRHSITRSCSASAAAAAAAMPACTTPLGSVSAAVACSTVQLSRACGSPKTSKHADSFLMTIDVISAMTGSLLACVVLPSDSAVASLKLEVEKVIGHSAFCLHFLREGDDCRECCQQDFDSLEVALSGSQSGLSGAVGPGTVRLSLVTSLDCMDRPSPIRSLPFDLQDRDYLPTSGCDSAIGMVRRPEASFRVPFGFLEVP